MINLDPKAAAARIRDAFQKEPPPISADDRHGLAYLEAVCRELGVEPNQYNVAQVAHLMAKADIGQHHPNEYPKMLVTKDQLGRVVNINYPDGHENAGQPVVLYSAEDEEALRSGSPDLFTEHEKVVKESDEREVARKKALEAKVDPKAA